MYFSKGSIRWKPLPCERQSTGWFLRIINTMANKIFNHTARRPLQFRITGTDPTWDKTGSKTEVVVVVVVVIVRGGGVGVRSRYIKLNCCTITLVVIIGTAALPDDRSLSQDTDTSTSKFHLKVPDLHMNCSIPWHGDRTPKNLVPVMAAYFHAPSQRWNI